MELYLFRHGIAENGSPDAARQLTDKGKEKSAAIARMARRAGVEPSLIVSSPYVRAVETAEIAAAEFGYTGPIVRLESLVPHGTPEAVWNDISDHRSESAILLAGHEPLLSVLMSWLLASPALRVEMKKSTIVRIDVDSFRGTPRGILRWMIVPRLVE
jgi:phosphohistidine phosphatase